MRDEGGAPGVCDRYLRSQSPGCYFVQSDNDSVITGLFLCVVVVFGYGEQEGYQRIDVLRA
jgi:hypothetical protein